MKSTNILAAILVLFLTGACTTRAQLSHEKDSTTDKASASEKGSTVTSETIDAGKPTSEDAKTPAPNGTSGGGYSLEETKALVAALNGRVEELEHKEQTTKPAESADDYKKLQARIEELEKKLAAATAATPTPSEVKDYYVVGKEAYNAGHMEDAASAFEEYLKNPDAKNVEEITFLKGEAHFKLKNYKKAIVEFSKFPEKMPKSPYHPKALLFMGEAFEGLGMKDDGKAFYNDLIEKFPKSPEAKAAKKRMSKKK